MATIAADVEPELQLALDQVDDNPFQMWALEPEHVAELSADMQANGQLQAILVRPHPQRPDRYQAAFGHHRRAAAARAGWTRIRAVVRKLSDQEMMDYGVVENFKRRVPSAIDKARIITRLMAAPFNLSEAEAGKRVGLKAPSSASNLVKLLDLPAPMQAQVDRGDVPQRLARQLVPVARSLPQQAVEIANKVAKAENKEKAFDEHMDAMLRKSGRVFWKCNFKPEWTAPAPADLAKKAGEIGLDGQLPACKGCEFYLTFDGSRFCARPACFDLKTRAALGDELRRVAKRLGIPAAAGEPVTILYDGKHNHSMFGSQYSFDGRQKAIGLVRAKLPELRLVLVDGDSFYLEDVTGSEHVGLAATNAGAVSAWAREHVGPRGGVEKAPPPKNESAAQKTKRLAQEERQAERRRAARSTVLRSKQDTLWLLEHCAELVGGRITIAGGVLDLALEAVRRTHDLSMEWTEARSRCDDLAKSKAEGDRTVALVMRVLASKVFTGYGLKQEDAYDWPRAQRLVEAETAKAFRVPLPEGWNKPPIHHTDYNCWSCGQFASNTKLTQRDIAAGWLIVQQGKNTISVRCPECAKKETPALAKGKGIGK